MNTYQSEAELLAVVKALLGRPQDLLKRERTLLLSAANLDKPLVEETRALIESGGDPLGDAFCALRSAADRRKLGATYTPPAIVEAMTSWASKTQSDVTRIVDPGCGSGRFLMSAAPRYPKAELFAVEIDPMATLLLRANAKVLGFSNRLTVKLCDFRRIALPESSGPTLFIGNPPYVRHHDISEKAKQWFADTAAAYGFRASKLAGLHLHFFLKTRALTRSGDFGSFITAAEWIDVNYGSALRDMLADGLGGTALHLLSPQTRPFADALTTGAITCFEAGSTARSLAIRKVDDLKFLAPLSDGPRVSWKRLAAAPKWSVFVNSRVAKPKGHVELGEMFRVHRGQVTGANNVWIEGPATPPIPNRFLFPAITKAKELFAAGPDLMSTQGLRRIIDLPITLGGLRPKELAAIKVFLAWAEEQGADQSYIARHRRAWWSVGLKDPPPIICTYMARRPPAFVRNYAGARIINIAHGLYPRAPMEDSELESIARYLNAFSSERGGRTYAGGLTKFEPREIERLTLPPLNRLAEAA